MLRDAQECLDAVERVVPDCEFCFIRRFAICSVSGTIGGDLSVLDVLQGHLAISLCGKKTVGVIQLRLMTPFGVQP